MYFSLFAIALNVHSFSELLLFFLSLWSSSLTFINISSSPQCDGQSLLGFYGISVADRLSAEFMANE